jgi:hypothetical protein
MPLRKSTGRVATRTPHRARRDDHARAFTTHSTAASPPTSTPHSARTASPAASIVIKGVVATGLLGWHHGPHKHGCLVRRQRQLAMPHRLAPVKEMLRADLMPVCHLRHDRPRRKRFRDDPSLVLVTPPSPATKPLRISTRPRGAEASTIWSTIYANRCRQQHLRTYAARCKMRAKHRLQRRNAAEKITRR